MYGEKAKKRVGGEMKSNFKDADYHRLSKMVEAMHKRIDKLELVRREDYTSLCEQVEFLNDRVNDMEVGDDFNDARRLIEEEKNDDKKQLFEEANADKKMLFKLIEEMNVDKKRMLELIKEVNDDKKKMFQLIKDVNARVDKLQNKLQNEMGTSQGLMLNSPTSSGKKVDPDIRIYVAKLPQSVSERHLHDYFGNFGEITNVKVVLDKITNLSRGVGFVTFKFEDSRRRVLCQKVHELHGSLLDVQKAKPLRDSPKRHGGVRDSPKRHGGASSSAAANTFDVSGGVQPSFLPRGPPPYGYRFFTPACGFTYPYL